MKPLRNEDKIDKYTYYLIIGLSIFFLFCVLVLVLRFVVNVLCLISIGV